MTDTPPSADAPARPIEAAGTSTAGAVGVTAGGPIHPVLVTSFTGFTQVFGARLPEPDAGVRERWTMDGSERSPWWRFALCVKGYFDNGGQRLYIVGVGGRDRSALAVSDVVAAIGLLDQVDEVSLCLAPGLSSALVHDALIDQCAR